MIIITFHFHYHFAWQHEFIFVSVYGKRIWKRKVRTRNRAEGVKKTFSTRQFLFFIFILSFISLCLSDVFFLCVLSGSLVTMTHRARDA